MRDTQKGKLYLAEQEAFERLSYGVDAAPGFETVKDCQRFVDRVLRRKRVRETYGPLWVTVKDGRGRRSGIAHHGGLGGGSIHLPKVARRSWYIVHELAHLLAPREAKHGWKFAEVYLDLVRQVFGRDCYDLLREQFARLGVEWKDPDRFAAAARGADPRR